MIMTEDRFLVMKRTQTLHVLLISGLLSFALGSSEFHLIIRSETFQEAKSYCREMYTDLATVNNSVDMDTLVTLASNTTLRAWIGLENGGVGMWHWSLSDQKLDFLNWRAGEPQSEDQDACAAMDGLGTWFESDCGILKRFVCQGNGDASGPIYVALAKSWRGAQDHCRGLSSDLVSIQSEDENEAVHIVSLSQHVWIGLFKDPWKWSDGSNSSFRFWKPNQPNDLNNNQDCVAAIFKDEGKWNDRNCNDRRRFVCYGARNSSNQGPLTTEQTQENMTTLPSQGVIVTYHFTVAVSNNQSNATNVTTSEATTANKLPTPNATEFVSSTSSTELNNATTEMSTLIATQLPPTTTVQVDGASALTTPTWTSAQSTTQASTLKTTENSQGLPPSETLILIQENMTWIEAMSYCREHHIDLVHIITQDIQGKVAEKARNATSTHVWLGLRYTCNSNFWFWISSTTGCYHNWALGQGYEVTYECGVTGAIEATGRQQWVGLPETEKLNFICSACAG